MIIYIYIYRKIRESVFATLDWRMWKSSVVRNIINKCGKWPLTSQKKIKKEICQTNVLKTGPDRPVQPVQPSITFLVRFALSNHLAIGPVMNLLNRRSDQWPDGTGRFKTNRKLAPYFVRMERPIKFNWFFLKAIMASSYDKAHTPTPTNFLAESWAHQTWLCLCLRMAFIGVICILIPLIFRCGIAN